MSTPAIPYIDIPELPLTFLGPLFGGKAPSIKPFGTLVAFAVYVGSVYALRRAKERAFDTRKLNMFIYWVVGSGFVISHILDAIFYHPDKVAEDPIYLFKIWDGLSSYGGFIGAVVGVFLYRAYYRERVLPYVDTVGSAFPFAWIFGRMGCATVHDHPGKISDAWYAVKYPDLVPQGLGRYDLGLYELVLTIPLALLCHFLWRRGTRPYGYFVGVICVYYAPIRFVLDFFREVEITPGMKAATQTAAVAGGDPRYGGLTPAQWACFGLLAVGIFFLKVVATQPSNQIDEKKLVKERARREKEEAGLVPPSAPTATKLPASKLDAKKSVKPAPAKQPVVDDVEVDDDEVDDQDDDRADDEPPPPPPKPVVVAKAAKASSSVKGAAAKAKSRRRR